MKSPNIGTLTANEPVTALFLVLSKEIRQKKTGEPYLSLHLSDCTGEIEAKMWDNVAEVMNTFERDDFVKVKGLMQVYQNRAQFTIHRLRRLEEHEVNLADYFPASTREPEEMFAELRAIIAGMSNPHLKALLESVFSDAQTASLYKMAPAAKSIHHAYRSGLIEHVLSLCALSRLAASHYKHIDLDLLLTGAILHDIGKVEELSFARSFSYSAEGQLLGHIVLGVRFLGQHFDKQPGFPSKLRSLLEHMIISHHGELEFGSPKVPIFAEALLLHHLDNLDSKMDAIRAALLRDQQVDGEFTGWIGSLERVLLKKERYLEGPKPPAPKAEAPAAAKPEAAPARPGPISVKPESIPIKPEPIPIKPEPAHPIPAAPVPLSHPIPAQPAAQALPAPPLPNTQPKPEYRPPQNTLFAEKLQAVLETRK